MSAEVMAHRTGPTITAFSDDDLKELLKYPEGELLKVKITGARKERAYRELCCYKGSCKYIANLNLSHYLDTPKKVDYMTKIRLGFIDGVIVDPKDQKTHFMPKSLSYSNCDQQESHKFIADALQRHAELVGLDDADQYVALLRRQK